MSEIEVYKGSNNEVQVEVQFEEETVWFTQAQTAVLFDRNRVAITQHIGNIFTEGELDEKVVCKDFLQTSQHGSIEGITQISKVK